MRKNMRFTRPHASSFLLAALAAAVPCAIAIADTVTKKDGTKIEGKIIEQNDAGVTIDTTLGQLKIPKADIKDVQTGKTSAEQFQEKWDAVDRKDASALLDLAKWCEENKLSREAKKVYREIVDKVEPNNEAARRALGFVKVGDTWKTKTEIDAEKKAADDKAKAEKNKNAKPDKAKTDKNKKSGKATAGGDLEFPPDIKPFIEAGKENATEDKKLASSMKDDLSRNFSTLTSENFRMAIQLPPDDAATHLKIAEKCLFDANGMFDLGADNKTWSGKMMIFEVNQKGDFHDLTNWVHKNYAEIPDQMRKSNKDSGGLTFGSPKGPVCTFYESGVPLKNAIPQWVGMFFITGYSRNGVREWMRQGFAMNLAIHEFGVSLLTFVTDTKYENNVEIADKNSDNAYKLLCWDMIEGRLETGTHPWNELRKKDLNALDYADLAKSWSMVDFLMNEKKEELKKFLAICAQHKDEEDALRAAFGFDGLELDKQWEAYVRANYEKAPPSAPKKK